MKFERTKELNMSIEIYLTNRYYIEKIFGKYDNLFYCCNTTKYKLDNLLKQKINMKSYYNYKE